MYKDFTEMSFWKAAMEAAEEISSITEGLSRKEDYGLTSQIRRSSTSIAANIAEAYGRTTSADKSQFYDYARGSVFETRSHLIYGHKVGYFKVETLNRIGNKLNDTIHELNKIKVSLKK
jgi:four helix bundle protein